MENGPKLKMLPIFQIIPLKIIFLGTKLTPDRESLRQTGDTLATVMAWLSDTPVGGSTTFFGGVDLVR